MNDFGEFLKKFYGVFIKPQTYLNLLYLLLAFPLGLAYFILLVTGFSLGIGLIILWVGLLILGLVFAISWALTAFERSQAIGLLHVDVPPMSHPAVENASLWQRTKTYLSNPVTWKGLAFLFLKFPIGLAGFIALVTLIPLSLGLLAAPFSAPWGFNLDLGIWQINGTAAASIAFLVGVVVAPASMHLLNLMADLMGKFAVVMLGMPRHQAPAVVPPAGPVEPSLEPEASVPLPPADLPQTS